MLSLVRGGPKILMIETTSLDPRLEERISRMGAPFDVDPREAVDQAGEAGAGDLLLADMEMEAWRAEAPEKKRGSGTVGLWLAFAGAGAVISRFLV